MPSEIVMKYCYCSKKGPPYYAALHIHKYWELVYYTGIGISTVDGISFNYMPGSYVIIPPDVPHSEKSLNEGIVYCLGFETGLDLSALPNSLFFDDKEHALQKKIDSMVKEVKEELPYFAERTNILLHDLLVLTMRNIAPKMKKTDHKMDMILNYIDAYYTMEIDFKMMANSLNYSYDYMRHYFKMHMHMSIKQYITQRRIFLAKKLLILDKPISEVSQECGFSYPEYFSAVFRQETGLTPTEYRYRHSHLVNNNETILCKKLEQAEA